MRLSGGFAGDWVALKLLDVFRELSTTFCVATVFRHCEAPVGVVTVSWADEKGMAQYGVDRRVNPSAAGLVGRRTFHRRNRPPARRVEKRGGRQGASAGFAGASVSNPPRRAGRECSATARRPPRCRSDIAAAAKRGWLHCRARALARGPTADAPSRLASRRFAAPGSTGAANLRAHRGLLLADWRARNSKLLLLRRRFSPRQAVLRRSRAARLRQASRPPRGCRLTVLSRATKATSERPVAKPPQ